jgi:hypothetical protein
VLVWLLVLLTATAFPGRAQERQGNAEFSFQSFFLGGSERKAEYTTGPATRFSYFFPRYGLLHGNLAPFVANGKVRGAETYAGWKGLPWAGRLWSFNAGDFRQETRPANLMQAGVYWPDFRLRGLQAAAASDRGTITAFAGRVSVTEGARIPVTRSTTQTVAGVEAERRLNEQFKVRVRVDELRGGSAGGMRSTLYLPEERKFQSVTEAVGQVTYEPRKGVVAYGELSGNSSRRAESDLAAASRWGAVAGVHVDTERLGVRASYTRQGTAYLPLVGQYGGDKQGAYFETRYQVWKGVGVFGSVSRYSNNVERDPGRTNFNTDSATGGVTANLPFRTNVLAQWSENNAGIQPPGGSATVMRNRQMFISAGRAFQRHQVRMNLRQMVTRQPGRSQELQSIELQDSYVSMHWNGGGGVRMDRSTGTDPRTSLVFRGFFSGQFGVLNAFLNAETGNDLLSRNVFAAAAFRSTGGGVGIRLKRGWQFSAEAMRMGLHIDLNPANVFLLNTQGVQPATLLAASNQWQAYLRLSHGVHWGGAMQKDVDGATTAAGLPLTGAVEGFVNIEGVDPAAPAPGVAVLLDGNRPAVADENGRFRFEEVPQGEHVVQLHLRELPADFNPADIVHARVVVQPRKTARAEFHVVQLGAISGALRGPAGTNPGGVVIRMRPGNEYAVTDEQGRFAFYNVKPGAYELSIDPEWLPEGTKLPRADVAAVRVRPGARQQVELHLEADSRGPVRRLSMPAIQVDPPSKAAPSAPPPGPGRLKGRDARSKESGRKAQDREQSAARLPRARARRPDAAQPDAEASRKQAPPAPRAMTGKDGEKALFTEPRRRAIQPGTDPPARKRAPGKPRRVQGGSSLAVGTLILDGGKVLN